MKKKEDEIVVQMQILIFFHTYSRPQISLTWPAFTLNKTIYQTSRKGKKQDKTIAEFAFQENLEKILIEIYSAYNRIFNENPNIEI